MPKEMCSRCSVVMSPRTSLMCFGVGPALGRAFSAPEEQPGADQVAVVSYGFWQQRFAGDAGLLGKTIQMNEKKYTVIGIMPRGFNHRRRGRRRAPELVESREPADDLRALFPDAATLYGISHARSLQPGRLCLGRSRRGSRH